MCSLLTHEMLEWKFILICKDQAHFKMRFMYTDQYKQAII